MTSREFVRDRLGAAFRATGSGVETAFATARFLFGAAGEAGPPPREPYVQGVTASSAVVAWVDEEPGVGRLRYGKTPELGREGVDPRVGRRHAVALTGLDPGSTYHYRVGGTEGPSAAGRFSTAPAGDGSRFSFAVIGDSGDGGRGQLAVAGLLGRLGPDLILHTGDVVYPAGEERRYDRRFFAPYRQIIGEVPVFPVLGNHDLGSNGGAAYFRNFHPPRDDPRNTKRYYSFDWGGAHFAARDSELYHGDGGASPEEQKAFLERDLAATRGRLKFAFLHRSPYGSSRHGGDEKVREDLEPVFARHAVDVVFAGHDHVYERTVPIRGVTYVVSGGGGRRLYPAGKSRWTACSASAHHAVLARVDGGRLSLEAVEEGGTVVDRWDLDRP